MRLKILYFTAVICLLIYACKGKTDSNSESKSVIHSLTDTLPILNVLNEQAKFWNKGDIDGYMQGYWKSDSLRFIGKRGIKYGYDSITAMYKRHYSNKEKMGHLLFSGLNYTHLSSVPEIVNVTGKWAISGKDSAGGFFSLLMKPVNGEWKIITDHTW